MLHIATPEAPFGALTQGRSQTHGPKEKGNGEVTWTSETS
jgi:hypothetical protein